MEATLLHSFVKAGNLKRWLNRPDCPAAIKECKAVFDKAYSQKAASSEGIGFEGEDTSVHANRRPRAVPPALSHLVVDREVFLQARIKLFGIFYAAATTHLGNSLVMFYPDGNRSSSPIPASIKYIFSKGDETFFAVERQLPRRLDDSSIDPFAKYPHFPAVLYQVQMSTELEKIKLDWIAGHYARWIMPNGYAVVLPLSKVNISRLLQFASNHKKFTGLNLESQPPHFLRSQQSL